MIEWIPRSLWEEVLFRSIFIEIKKKKKLFSSISYVFVHTHDSFFPIDETEG